MQIIIAIASSLVVIGMAIIGYFVSQLNQRLDRHEEKFDKLWDRIDNTKGNDLLYEKLDKLKEDIVTKRHAMRAEMREAFTSVHDRAEKLEERLMHEIGRVENKIK